MTRAIYVSDLVTKLGPQIDARSYGSPLTDITIQDAIDAIGVGVATLIISPGTWILSDSVTVPVNISLKILSGGLLSIDAGKTLTINGPFEAPLCQVFDVAYGDLIFGDGATDHQFIEWYGGVADDLTDNLSAFQVAQNVSATHPPIIKLLPGIYRITGIATYGGIYSSSKVLKIVGSGMWVTTIKNISVAGITIRYSNSDCVLTDLTIDNNGSTGTALQVDGQYSIIKNVRFLNQGGTAYSLFANACTLSYFENIVINDDSAGGAYFYMLNGSIINGLHLGKVTATPLIKIVNCTGLTFLNCTPSAEGPELAIEIINCHSIHFYGLYFEMNAVFTGGIAVDIGGSSKNINFNGVYANLYDTSCKLFNLSSSSIHGVSIQGLEVQNNSAGAVVDIICFSESAKNVRISDVSTYMLGTVVGVNMVAVGTRLHISNWHNGNAAVSFVINALSLFMANVLGDIELTVQDRQVLLNCDGVVTGTGANTHTVIPDKSETVTTTGTALSIRGSSRVSGSIGAIAVTLADASIIGAIKTIYCVDVSVGNVTLTVANHETSIPEVFTFDTAGDSLTLQWNGSVWCTLHNKGVTV